MASGSVPTASGGVYSVAGNSAFSSSNPQPCPRASVVSFRLAHQPKLRLFPSKAHGLNFGAQRSCIDLPKSQLTEAVGGPSNDPAAIDRTPDVPDGDGAGVSSKEAAAAPMPELAVSEFMKRVASLVKLVDSKDIVELQLKRQDCELVIRKKEALPPPPAPAHVVFAQHQLPPPVLQPQLLASSSSAPAASAPTVAGALPAPRPTPPTAAKSVKSSIPPLKSPMAGTFYRSPGPGQPPFVKVGDKVNKGQAVCIIEAMKLMNEIEADQAGTVIEVLVDDTKPVAIDQPLFAIEP